jgi:hypothetical protein
MAQSDNGPRELADQVAGARLLLDYGVSRGLVDDATIVEGIIAMERALGGADPPGTDTISGFLKAYNSLSKLANGVTADSLSAAATADQLRARRVYFWFLVFLLVLSIPITTISAVGGQLVTSASETIAKVCKDYPAFGCDPANKAGAAWDTSAAAVTDVSIKTTSAWGELSFIALFTGYAGTSKEELNHVWQTNTAQGIWATFLEVYYDSFPIIEDFKLIYGTLSSYALPILFAMLGAVTYGLRDLRQRMDPPTWVSRGESLALLRIVTAGLAGYLITAINGITSEVQFSPILIAFIIGYSLDVFFVLLDALVSQVKGAKSA